MQEYGSLGPQDLTPEGLLEKLKQFLTIDLNDFQTAASRLSEAATQINSVFTQGRQRMIELVQATADAVPGVMRLGGEVQDVTNAIKEVAIASRRNVVATADEVEKLYAANKVLGESASDLTNAFLNVGMSVKDIGPNLEDSIRYVQSIGGNAKEVVVQMRANMEQLNRFQFEGGVKGLTKMAAQASMLRFDMSETFQLAEQVLDPEKAIEVASAFQRLGVSAGNLVDPFQLMNQSINDPSGLQDSLANVAKQFSYFDEKTKTFKINPQGVLTLREMQQQTGVSAREMSKMAIAAADLDRRLSAVNAAGVTIASEEDKQYLANIARMTEQGTYEVTIKDEKSGKLITKDLTDITQKEFDKLIQEQKDGPKTLEDLARSQMNIQQSLEADVSAIKNKIVGGVVSAQPIQEGFEQARNLITSITGELSKSFPFKAPGSDKGGTKEVRGKIEDLIFGIKGLVQDLSDPKKNVIQTLRDYMGQLGGGLEKIEAGLSDAFQTALSNAEKKLDKDKLLEGKAKEYLGMLPGIKTPTNLTSAQQAQAQDVAKQISQQYGATATPKFDVGGKITIEVEIKSNQNFTEQQKQELVKSFTTEFEKLGIQKKIEVQIKQNMGTNPLKAANR